MKLGNLFSDNELPVFVGIKQGAFTSPIMYYNASFHVQIGLPINCISKWMDTSVFYCADNLLNPCRSIASLQRGFDNLSNRYLQIGLNMNGAKSHVLFFNLHSSYVHISVCLSDSKVAPTTALTSLGLPIGSSIKDTRKLLLRNTKRKLEMLMLAWLHYSLILNGKPFLEYIIV